MAVMRPVTAMPAVESPFCALPVGVILTIFSYCDHGRIQSASSDTARQQAAFQERSLPFAEFVKDTVIGPKKEATARGLPGLGGQARPLQISHDVLPRLPGCPALPRQSCSICPIGSSAKYLPLHARWITTNSFIINPYVFFLFLFPILISSRVPIFRPLPIIS